MLVLGDNREWIRATNRRLRSVAQMPRLSVCGVTRVIERASLSCSSTMHTDYSSFRLLKECPGQRRVAYSRTTDNDDKRMLRHNKRANLLDFSRQTSTMVSSVSPAPRSAISLFGRGVFPSP